jgi:hypothetical protein
MKRALIASISPAAAEDTPHLTGLARVMARREAEDAGLDLDPGSVEWKVVAPPLPHLYDENGQVVLDEAGVPVPAPWGLRVEYNVTSIEHTP